jgi:spermidine synthase
MKNTTISNYELKNRLEQLKFSNVPTKWINTEAMKLLTSFGKDRYLSNDSPEQIEINKIHNPVLYQYYLKGNWDLY